MRLGYWYNQLDRPSTIAAIRAWEEECEQGGQDVPIVDNPNVQTFDLCTGNTTPHESVGGSPPPEDAVFPDNGDNDEMGSASSITAYSLNTTVTYASEVSNQMVDDSPIDLDLDTVLSKPSAVPRTLSSIHQTVDTASEPVMFSQGYFETTSSTSSLTGYRSSRPAVDRRRSRSRPRLLSPPRYEIPTLEDESPSEDSTLPSSTDFSVVG